MKLVNVFVNVTDANGAPVGGLTKENFTLAEDGRPQKIAVFDRESAVPLAIVLAIDTSGTVHKDMSIEEHAAREFVHALLRPVDQLDLMEFASDVREVVPFTNNLHQIDNGLGPAARRPGDGALRHDLSGLAELAGRPGRKVLVLISDGDDTVKGVGLSAGAGAGAALRGAGLQHHRCADRRRRRARHRGGTRADDALAGDGRQALLCRIVEAGVGISEGVGRSSDAVFAGVLSVRAFDFGGLSDDFGFSDRRGWRLGLFAAASDGYYPTE